MQAPETHIIIWNQGTLIHPKCVKGREMAFQRSTVILMVMREINRADILNLMETHCKNHVVYEGSYKILRWHIWWWQTSSTAFLIHELPKLRNREASWMVWRSLTAELSTQALWWVSKHYSILPFDICLPDHPEQRNSERCPNYKLCYQWKDGGTKSGCWKACF